jgi:hypothetical protein
MAMFIIPSWLVAFAPLYILVPRKSILWRWYACAPLGGLAGAIIMQSFFAYSELCVYHTTITRALDFVWPLTTPATVVGAATCLVATLTFDLFNPKQS